MKKLIAMLMIAVLLLTGTALAKGTYLGTLTVVNCQSWVTLRSSPSTKASAVTRIPRGELVEAYKYDEQFAECYYNGMHGFVLKDYLG